MDQVSITIPNNRAALLAASQMFATMAEALSPREVSTDAWDEPEPVITPQEPPTPVDALVDFTKAAVEAGHPEPPAPPPSAAEVFARAVEGPVETPSKAEQIVNLDARGLPWDVRINAKNKAKTKGGDWKYGRNIDKSLIETVEAELRTLMAIPAPPNMALSLEPTEPDDEGVPPNGAATPPPPPPPAQAGITTYPQFVTKMREMGTDNAAILPVLNKHGVQSIPMLAARPDLIPAIAADLGYQ